VPGRIQKRVIARLFVVALALIAVAASTKRPPTDAPNPDLVWDEYKYRHDICWKIILQTTVGAVLIYVVPYIEQDVAAQVRYWMVVLPVIGIVFLMFGLARFRKEEELLAHVRAHHWSRQRASRHHAGSFKRHATWYMCALIALGVLNIVVICAVWVPRLS
jgi:hypothetical protein